MSMLLGTAEGRFIIRALEVHASHSCNLHCDGCRHYSNYNHVGMLDPARFEAWLAAWSPRIEPRKFRMVGGEPSLNPKLLEIIRLAHRAWPEALRQVTSNGFFLHRHPDLIDTLIETGTRLAITIHSHDPDYLENLAPVRRMLEDYRAKTGVRLLFEDVTEEWSKNYHGAGSAMRPYEDAAPRQSWDACDCKQCMQLHEGRLWKCPPIAYLEMALKKFELEEEPAWQPYRTYAGLGPEASDAELESFLRREEESICGMCPASPTYMADKSIDWKREYAPPRRQKVLSS